MTCYIPLKNLEECYSMIVFSNTITETITITKLKVTLKYGKSMKVFNNNDMLYTVEKILKSAIQ